jgi:hypothetical protein
MAKQGMKRPEVTHVKPRNEAPPVPELQGKAKSGKKKAGAMEEIRTDPEERLCPRFDSVGIAMFPVADPGEMGFRVLDDCTEEHIQ